MGVRTAAGKLGFQLAKVNWIFSRRSIACLSTSTDQIVEKEKSFNLFLCFDRRIQFLNQLDTNVVFHPIRLDTYDDDKEEELLETESDNLRFRVYKDILDDGSDSSDRSDSRSNRYDDRYEDEEKEKLRFKMACQTKIIRLGSKILFTVGQTTPRDICWVEPTNDPVKFHVSSQTETKIKSFSTPKLDMRWGVIDGKLYCFDNCPALSPSFQVLDPETDNNSWDRLSDPPFIKEDGGTDKYNVLFLNESRKILGWEDAGNGVYCFDATKPEKGWIELACGFRDAISLIGQNDIRLVIHDNHPKLGDFNLMFRYDCYDEPFIISPFYISHNCDSFQSISKPIRLPKLLCSKYRIGHLDAYNSREKVRPRKTFDSQFVDLGSKKFCLILHKFTDEDRLVDNRTKGNILVATFEYDIVSNKENDSEPPLEIKTRILGTRRFQYCLMNMRPGQNDLIGAFSF